MNCAAGAGSGCPKRIAPSITRKVEPLGGATKGLLQTEETKMQHSTLFATVYVGAQERRTLSETGYQSFLDFIDSRRILSLSMLAWRAKEIVMLTQHITQTDRGLRITVSDTNHYEKNLIHSAIYGEATADQVQKALEALTAFHLDLTSASELRKHPPMAMKEAMIIWNAIQGVERV